MSEPEVATKAPESDAQEFQPESSAASGSEEAAAPKMSEHCTSDRPTPSGHSSSGEITKLGGVDVYISKPSDYPHAPVRFLLLLTGGTGLRSVNNQIQADRFATEGFVVVMPDLFEGDPAPNSGAIPSEEQQAQEQAGSSFLDSFKIKAAETAKSFLIDMWLARHTEAKVLPILHKVMDASRDEFADAISGGGGIYAVGYCFGARYVLLLAGERPVAAPAATIPSPLAMLGGAAKPKPAAAAEGGSNEDANKPKTVGPYIKAGALAHATLVSREDFVGLKAPVSLACVENDPMFPDDVRIAGEDYMGKNNVEHEVQVYPGVPHGFAVVGDYDDANIQVAQATAFDQMLKWLKEH